MKFKNKEEWQLDFDRSWDLEYIHRKSSGNKAIGLFIGYIDLLFLYGVLNG